MDKKTDFYGKKTEKHVKYKNKKDLYPKSYIIH